MVHLLHVRLLVGLLASLSVGDWQAHANAGQAERGSSVQRLAEQSCIAQRAVRQVVNLRMERQDKLECAPPHSARMLFDAFVADDQEHDDEEYADPRVAVHVPYPASLRRDRSVCLLPVLSRSQTQLERPPRV